MDGGWPDKTNSRLISTQIEVEVEFGKSRGVWALDAKPYRVGKKGFLAGIYSLNSLK